MKTTISLLQTNAAMIEDAEAELLALEHLPYYEIMRAYSEKEDDKRRLKNRIKSHKQQRLTILEKLEAQIQEEKKKLKSVTNAEAA